MMKASSIQQRRENTVSEYTIVASIEKERLNDYLANEQGQSDAAALL